MSPRTISILHLFAALLLTATCHMPIWNVPPLGSIKSATPPSRLQPEPDFETKIETVAPGVEFAMPVKRSAAMQFTPIPAVSGDPNAALDKLLRAEECNMPAVVKWREQWRGDCLTPVNQRIRIALVKGPSGWAGLRIDYADVNNLGMAPVAKRILDSGRALQ